MALTNLMYKNVHFDSDEEVFVAMWLEDLKKAKVIADWIKPTTGVLLSPAHKIKYTKKTVLKTKIKSEIKEKTILREFEYTPDFLVSFPDKMFSKYVTDVAFHLSNQELNPSSIFYHGNVGLYKNMVILEVKPNFDMHNMQREFIYKQKIAWDKYKMFVNLVEPVELFKKTFLPLEAAPYFKYRKVPKKAAAAGKKVGDFKFDWKPKTLEEFLNEC